MHDSKGYVTFINVGSGKAIDVYGGKSVNGQNVAQYTSNNSLAQKWIVKKASSGFNIVSALNPNYVLDLYGGRVSNFGNVQIYKSNNTKAQAWNFIKYESPRSQLDSMAKKYNADIQETTYIVQCYKNNNYSLGSSGSNVQISNSNQKWRIKKDSVGYITFINVSTNKALDVYGGHSSNSTNVWQYNYNNSLAQKWIAKKNSDGSLTFVSALDKNHVLDISGGLIQNRQNVQLYQNNGTNAQKFKLTKI